MSDDSLLSLLRVDFTEEELADQLQIINLLQDFFKDEAKKMVAWLKTENPLLGNVKPIDMIKTGRSERLLKFIRVSLEENML